MMSFRTVLPLPGTPFHLDHAHKILMLGSCFTENIGSRLNSLKFDVLINPFGTIYNPLAKAGLLINCGSNEFEARMAYDTKSNLYFDYNYHGKLSSLSEEEHQYKVQKAWKAFNNYAKDAQCLILSPGTAFAYYLKEDGQIVANCHKQANDLFIRKLLDANSIVTALKKAFESLWRINPELKIILTISPVRHIADGLIENNLSKAQLLIACHDLCQLSQNVSYFPAYELLLDDLRDYRFYDKDMLHPNESAIDYIWKYFSDCYFNEKTRDIIKEVEAINRGLTHRAFHPESPAHKKFLLTLTERIAQLSKSHRYLDYRREKELLKKMLK